MIHFRPHHFLCALGFQGLGYSPDFVANFQKIVDRLRAPDGDLVEIKVVGQADDICGACPEKRGHLCATQAKIDRLDQAHAQALGIAPGDTLTWGEAKTRIKTNISVETHHHICASCQWRDLGVCAQALQELKS